MSIIHVPFYPSDWMAGTAGLSDAERGVYITLIARMYEMAGPIERDDERLFRVCGSKSKASFVKALSYLISEGKIVFAEGALFNEKVAKVIKQTTEKSDKAKAAAQSRWDRKPNKNKGGVDANASSGHMPEACQLKLKPELNKDTYVSLGEFDFPEGKPPPKKPVKRATQIPDGWVPSERNIQDAISKQFTTEEISHEADRFRDYHLSKGSTYKNWDAAWRTWLGNARKFAGNSAQGQRNGTSRSHVIADAVREAGLRGFD